MLEIASVILAVVAVLFGVCLTIFIKSYQKYTNEDEDGEREERSENRRKKPAERSDADVKSDRPKRTEGAEKAEKAVTKRPKEPEKPSAGEAARPETVKKDAPAAGQPVKNEAQTPLRPEKEEDIRPAQTPAPKDDETVREDISDTRVPSPEEIQKLRDAAQIPPSKNTSRFRLRVPDEPEPDVPESEDENAEGTDFAKFKPAIIGGAALAAVLILAVIAVAFTHMAKKHDEPQLPETVAVTVQDIQLQETLDGKISSPDVITSMFAATGKVTGLKVKEGDYVSKGNTIYTVDSSNLEARIDLLEERIAALSSSSSSSARTETTRANITASTGGTVTSLNVSGGDTVSAGDIVAEITVPATNQVTVTLKNRISVGQSVSVYSNGSTTQGTVRSVTQVSPAPAAPEDEESSSEDTDSPADNSDNDKSADSNGGAETDTQTGAQPDSQTGSQTGASTDTQTDNDGTGGSGQNTGDTAQPLWSAVINVSSSTAAGSTATVAVNGERVSGSVTRGRTSVISVAATSGGKITFRVSEGDRVNSGSIIATVENQRQVAGSSSDGGSNSFEAREARLELEQLETELENYTVKATVDGYVQKLFLKEGDTAAVGMNAVTVIPASGLMLTVEMSASLAAELETPLAATYRLIRSSNFDSSVWEKLNTSTNQIASIENIVPSESDPDKYIGYITLDDPSLYRDGMMADVTIVSYYAPHAITIPQELVKDGKVKILREGGQTTDVPVTTGAVTKDGYIEITDGLSSSDRVVTEQGAAQ